MLSWKQIGWLVLAFAIAASVWLGWAAFGSTVATHFMVTENIDKVGQWGDSFGALNALIGAAGTCLVLATLMAQRKALREQLTDLHKQRFDTTFFELLKLLRELGAVENNAENRRAITALSLSQMNNLATHSTGMSDTEIKARTLETYQEFVHSRFEHHLSPYFRVIYTMLSRIKKDNVLSEGEKTEYGNLLRGQLTSVEVALAGYNALTPQSKDFSDLLIKFRMFKYLPDNIHRQLLVRLYPSEAFAARGDDPLDG